MSWCLNVLRSRGLMSLDTRGERSAIISFGQSDSLTQNLSFLSRSPTCSVVTLSLSQYVLMTIFNSYSLASWLCGAVRRQTFLISWIVLSLRTSAAASFNENTKQSLLGSWDRREEAEWDNGHKEKNGFYAKISVSNKVSSRELLVMTLKYPAW